MLTHARCCLVPPRELTRGVRVACQLLAGCINVLFSDSLGSNGTDDWWGDVRRLAVLVPHTVALRGGVFAFLRALPHERVAALHATVLRERGRWHYALHRAPLGGDAIDVVVQALTTYYDAPAAEGRGGGNDGASLAAAVAREICNGTTPHRDAWLPF